MITRKKINMVWSLDIHNYFMISRRPVSSVGRASDYGSGGLGFKP